MPNVLPYGKVRRYISAEHELTHHLQNETNPKVYVLGPSVGAGRYCPTAVSAKTMSWLVAHDSHLYKVAGFSHKLGVWVTKRHLIDKNPSVPWTADDMAQIVMKQWDGEWPTDVSISPEITPQKEPSKMLRKVMGHDFDLAKSQKIRGLSAVAKVAQLSQAMEPPTTVQSWFWTTAREALNITLDDLHPAGNVGTWFGNGELFVRPCPTRPRHGFVDSGIVTSIDDIRAVAKASLEADPDAELLFTKFLKPTGNMILTEGSLSWGKGHEGATSGKAKVLFGPAISSWSESSAICNKARIAQGDTFYVEMVDRPKDRESSFTFYTPVQVRGGPPQQAATDYVPNAMKVTEVIVAHEGLDLQKWEKQIEQAGKRPGSIVYAPGMALSNHFCVHAVVNKVPCVTTFEPKVGDNLDKIECPTWGSKDWKRVAAAMEDADAFVAYDSNRDGFSRRMRSLARIGLSALHCAGTPAPATDQQVNFLALGAVAHAKMLAAACFGELRHARGCGEHGSERVLPIKRAIEKLYHSDPDSQDRSWYFDQTFAADTHALELAMYAVTTSFREMSWRSGYGGNKWASIAVGARQMLRAINQFRDKPNARNWAAIVSPWNKAINAEHNGGDGALGKFGLHKTQFDSAAMWPMGFLSNAQTTYIDLLFADALPKVPSHVIRVRRVSVPSVSEGKGSISMVGLLVRPTPAYISHNAGLRGCLSQDTSQVFLIKDLRAQAIVKNLPPEYSLPDSPLGAGTHYAIGRMKETFLKPVGGVKFMRSVRAVEVILSLKSRIPNYEPVKYSQQCLTSIEIAATGDAVSLSANPVKIGG